MGLRIYFVIRIYSFVIGLALEHPCFTLLGLLHQFSDDLIHRDTFGFGVEGRHQAMAQGRGCEGFDVMHTEELEEVVLLGWGGMG